MSLIHIANYLESDRRTVVADEDMPLGCVTIASKGATKAVRKVNIITSAADMEDAVLGVAFKVSAEPFQVSQSTANDDANLDLGARIVTIKEGDLCVQVRKGAIMAIDASLLHSSLDALRSGGAYPDPGDELAIDSATGLFCKDNVASAFTSPVFGVCYDVVGTKVRIELLAVGNA